MTAADQFKAVIVSQFEAALAMLHECIDKCPPDYWEGTIGRYPFWQVAYHTLCFVDCYLSRGSDDFKTRPEFHPSGMKELSEEYPSRRFPRPELLAYHAFCKLKLAQMLAADTAESLAETSGFSWLPFTRAELHLYNIRHVQHHTGQLSAFLRRVSIDTNWIKRGDQ